MLILKRYEKIKVSNKIGLLACVSRTTGKLINLAFKKDIQWIGNYEIVKINPSNWFHVKFLFRTPKEKTKYAIIKNPKGWIIKINNKTRAAFRKQQKP
jgi:hypothetical protein